MLFDAGVDTGVSVLDEFTFLVYSAALILTAPESGPQGHVTGWISYRDPPT